jgi:hypothetical protein
MDELNGWFRQMSKYNHNPNHAEIDYEDMTNKEVKHKENS